MQPRRLLGDCCLVINLRLLNAHLAANLGGAHKNDLADIGGGDQRVARLAVPRHNLWRGEGTSFRKGRVLRGRSSDQRVGRLAAKQEAPGSSLLCYLASQSQL